MIKKFLIPMGLFLIISPIFFLLYIYFPSNDTGNRNKKEISIEEGMEATKGDLKCKDCNLIMISLSNVSAKHMSLYGYERLTTPNFDKWAENAIVFNNAFTQSSWTLPVATSLFTSLYPFTHKIMNRFNENILDADIKTLPEILRDSGYRTAAFVGGLDYSYKFGHMRGFEYVDEAMDYNSAIEFAGFSYSLKKASDWLSQNHGGKFFLFLHGYDCHCPFNPPEKFRGRFSHAEGKNITVDNKECLRGYENSKNGNYEAYYYRGGQKKVVLTKDDIDYLEDLYDEEILSLDELIGNFLKSLNKSVLDKTIIIIFSDHGEMFAKHGRFGRAGAVRGTIYNTMLRVPLIIRLPGQKGKRIKGLAQLIDVMPTVLRNLDIPVPSDAQGKDLVGLITDDRPAHSYGFAGSRFGWFQRPASRKIYKYRSENEAVMTDEWKLIHEKRFTNEGKFLDDTYEFYNFNDDPDEMKNIFDKDAPKAKELKAVLEKWVMECYNFKVKSGSKVIPSEVAEEAKKRGYW